MAEVLFETIRLGRYVKISAIDPTTATEVSLTGDARLPVEHLQRMALRKLQAKLNGPQES